MKAVLYKGPFQVAVERVDDPRIEQGGPGNTPVGRWCDGAVAEEYGWR